MKVLSPVPIDGEYLHVVDSEGEGRDVLLVHGNSTSGRVFEPLLAGAAGRRYRLVAPDLPGYGETGPARDPGRSYTFDGQGRTVARVAEVMQLQDPVVVGFSIGGHWALSAVRQGLSPAGLVLVGCAPVSTPEDLAAAFLPFPALQVTLVPEPDPEVFELFAASLFRENRSILESEFRRSDPAARGVIGAAVARGDLPDDRRTLSSLECPVALILGEDDPVFDPRYLERLEIERLWRDGVQSVEGATHFVMLEQPQRFAEILGEFIESL